MIKTVISIVIFALTFVGFPAQAFVQSDDHGCCESEQFISIGLVSVITSPVFEIIQADSSVESNYNSYINHALHHTSAAQSKNSSHVVSQLKQDRPCEECDSLQAYLSCFSVDGVSFALFYQSKVDLGSPRSYSGLAPELQFITLPIAPAIRPPIV